MSSLGDLLLGKVRDRSPSPADDSKQGRNDNRDLIDKDHGDEKRQRLSPYDESYQPDSQKVFPDRVVKNEIKEEDCRSNTSSTDDYVRELLDPNDRPRNVWHVVEGPKKSNDDEEEMNSDDTARPIKQEPNYEDEYAERDEDRYHRDVDPNNGHSDEDKDNIGRETHNIIKAEDRTIKREAEQMSPPVEDREIDVDRDRDRGKDRDRERDRDRDRDRERDRDRDRHRHRHHDRDHDRDHERRRSHRSSRRHHDYSDDDDRDEERSRRHGSGHRSGKRSRSRHSSRRSRSGSKSPVTKRNSRTVLVMQLSPRATTRDLEDFFSDLGDVREVRLIMDIKTRRHKGIAYIEFENASSATKALALDGKKFLGVPMQIQSALLDRNKGDWHHTTSTSQHHHHHNQHHHSSVNTSSHSSSRSNLPPNSYRVYIGGLHVGLTEDMLRTIVEPFGSILRLELIKDRNTGVSRGYAFVLFANIEDGQEAVRNLDGFELADLKTRVSCIKHRLRGADSVYHPGVHSAIRPQAISGAHPQARFGATT